MAARADSSRWARWAPFLIVAAGIAVYANSFSGVFILDDVSIIAENPKIRSFFPLGDLLDGQRPLVNLSLAVNYALGGIEVRGYHAFNLAVHLLAALTLYGIVRRSLSGSVLGERYGPVASGFALTVALIWTVHPLQTQSVTYVIQRAESMMGLFYLLTIYCMIRGSDSVRSGNWYAVAVLACTMGMASKPIIVTAPVVVLLYDRVFLSGSFRELFRRRWGLHAGLALSWGLLAAVGAIRALFVSTTTSGAAIGFGYGGATAWEYLRTQPQVILHYLKLSVWPRSLCLDYAWPVAVSGSQIVFTGLAVAMLAVATVFAFRRRPWLGFVGAWFFIVLSPSSSFVPVPDLAVEHRMYLPLAAVVLFWVGGGYRIFTKLGARFPARRRLLRQISVLLIVVVVVSLGTRTVLRNRDYRSVEGMWLNVLAQRPENGRAHTSYANELLGRGELDGAIDHYHSALRFNPADAFAHGNLGQAYYRKGMKEEAREHLRMALSLDPSLYRTQYTLGLLLADEGRHYEAIARYRSALQIRPDLSEGHNNLGNLLRRVGRNDEAIEAFRNALEVNPADALAHFNLGLALESEGRLDEAAEEMRAALGLAPAERGREMAIGAHYSLARIYAYQQKLDQAIAECREVLRIEPKHDFARRDLERLVQLRQERRAP